MSQAKLEEIASHLLDNAKRLQFGSASLVLKVHSNRVTQIAFETTECIKEREEVQNEMVC